MNTITQLKNDKRTDSEKQADFLEAFRECVSIVQACNKSKVSRSLVYQKWLEKDKGFKKKFNAACKIATARLEDEAVRRGFEGTLEPVYQQGRKVGDIRKYSDTLLIVLLKARDPERFKERTYNEQVGKDGGPIKIGYGKDE